MVPRREARTVRNNCETNSGHTRLLQAMDLSTAHRIVEALADGVDPRTGEVLQSGSPLESPEVIRALHVALAAVHKQISARMRKSALPSNAGHSWSAEDDLKLADLFDGGETVANLSTIFLRTRGGIASRLVRLGKVPDRQTAFVANTSMRAEPHGKEDEHVPN